MKKKILTLGLRATGNIHLGHYYLFDKIKLFLKKNKNYKLYFLIADQHGIINTTDRIEMINIKKNTNLLIKSLCSMNFSTKQIILSSYLNCLNQTSWFLSELVKLNEILIIPNIKFDQKKTKINMSKIFYSILMTSEILLLNTNHLFFGYDQLQNFNIAKKIINRLNNLLKSKDEKFIFPTALFLDVLIGIDGKNKMSKSLKNVINIFSDKEIIKKQIMKILTDNNDFFKIKIQDNTIYKIFSFLFKKELEIYYKNKKTHYEVKISILENMLSYFKIFRENFNNYTDEETKILWKKVKRNTILWNRKVSRKIHKKIKKLFLI